MMLISVYDHKGEMFEVLPDHAKRLVVAEGWSMEPFDAVLVDLPVATEVAVEAVARDVSPHVEDPTFNNVAGGPSPL